MRGTYSHHRSLGHCKAAMLAAAAGSLAVPALAQPAGCPADCPPASQITICYEQGRADNYALPFDPLTPRPLFASLLSTYAISKPFDDPTVNAVCGTTFQNLPCGIVGASLEIQMRAEDDIPDNDSIYLQYTGTGFAYGSNIKLLPGAGGTWNPGQNQTFTLNLATLPGGLIGLMNASHALDVLVADDTTVEHARLTVTVCPCQSQYRVYTVGGVDNMAPPTEPTWRRPRLTALRTTPPFLWKDNDDCTVDRGWGHTFTSLPSGIVRADFTIRMVPCGGGSSNDGISFDLINQGGPEAFSRSANINLLAPPWTTNPLTNFNFNFNTLPPNPFSPITLCGSNLLGDFGDRTLDVYVQDDTGIDAARLRVQPCPPLRRFNGIPFTVRGDTQVTTFPAERRMEVRNLGSSGQDGVSFDVLGNDGTDWAFDPPCIKMLPVGSFFDVFFEIPDPETGEPQPAASLRMDRHESDALWVRDTSCTSAGSCKEWVIGDSATGEETTVCMPCDGMWTVSGSDVSGVSWRKGSAGAVGKSVDAFIKFKEHHMFLESGPVYFWKTGDYLILRNPTPSNDIEVSSFSWGVSDPAAYAGLQIIDDCPIEFGNTHTIPAAASNGLDTNRGGLTISNIGSSGQDGVTINLRQADEWTAAWDVICAGTYEQCNGVQTSMALGFTGSFGGMPGKPAGRSTVHRDTTQGFFDIDADYTDIGCHTLIIKVFDQNGIMTGMTATNTPFTHILAQGEDPPSGCGKQGIIINGGRTACLWWDWKHPIFFNIPGLPPMQGSQIRILAADPPAPFDYIESATLNFAGMQDVDITSEQTVQIAPPPPPCFADFNQDGGIDGADVSAFFEAWEAGSASADVNNDGGVDGADVQEFFRAWEAGAC